VLFLVCVLVAFIANVPTPTSLWKSRDTLSVQGALSRYRQHVQNWAARDTAQRKVRQANDVFMANLEQTSSATVIDFDVDAFDVATDNCASKTSTPYFSDLYEAVPVDNAVLNGVGTSKVTHIGKAKYLYVDDNGREITIDDHEVLVCPGLPTRILSIPSWATQLEHRHGPRDQTRVTSYGHVTHIFTDRNRSQKTIAHHDRQGIPVMRARLASNDSYSTYSACFPCYNLNVVSDDEDSDYHVPAARRDQRR
jgi:hypothetical protein